MADPVPDSPWLSLLFTAAIVGAGVIVVGLMLDAVLRRYVILAPPDQSTPMENPGDDLAA